MGEEGLGEVEVERLAGRRVKHRLAAQKGGRAGGSLPRTVQEVGAKSPDTHVKADSGGWGNQD